MRFVAALALVLLNGSVHLLPAPSISAWLTGQVTDSSQAQIVDARITAISAGTKAAYETVTNSSGEYYLSSLAPGTYRIEVEKTGFKKVTRPDVVLHVQDAVEIDFELTVGPATDSIVVGAGDLLRVTDLVSPNANFGFVTVTDNAATSNYNALQVKFERRLSRGLQSLASYIWSHSIDIASTDAFANYLNTPTSVANPNTDRGNSDFDIRNSFTAGVTYALPSRESNEFTHAALGGWSMDSFIFARTAPPVDVVGAIEFADGIALYPRPDVKPGVPLVLHGSQYPDGKAFNPSAFTAPPTGQ